MDYLDRTLKNTTRNKLLILFLLSGFTGLSYEIVWQKQMILLLGADATAIVSILTSFFLGIAFGGKIASRLLQLKKLNVLKSYAICEFIVAIWALSMPFILSLMEFFYVGIAEENAGTMMFVLRFCIAVILVLPATLAMGATIPFMSLMLSNDNDNGVRLAYGINTAGGIIGLLCVNFIFLPSFGIQHSIYFILMINLMLALTALIYSTNINIHHSTVTNERLDIKLSIAYFLSGFIALGAEIVWLRILAIQTTNGHLMFSLVLLVYLFGFSCGSLFLHPFLERRYTKESELIRIVFAIPIAIFITIPLMKLSSDVLTRFVYNSIIDGGFHPRNVFLSELYSIIVAVFLPSFFMGAVFPGMSRFTSNIGNLYFFGNLGAVLGIFTFGLWLIPWLGLVKSLLAIIIIASFIILLLPVKLKTYNYFILLTIILITFGINSVLAPFTKLPDDRQKLSDGRPFYKTLRYSEGVSATVVVREVNNDPSSKHVFVDDQLVASTVPGAIVDSKMLAHIPLMLHGDAKNALTVGFGSGGTSWSMALYPIEVYAVEIEPEIISSAYLFPYGNILQKKNFHAILNDARDHLHTTKRKYDVISTDVTNLQYKQNANLYTVEYFQLMKNKLTQYGVACAWIPLAAISPAELKTLIKTFKHVFPHTSFWFMHELPTTFAILIGTTQKLKIDLRKIKNFVQNPLIADDLKDILVNSVSQFPSFVVMDEDEIDRYVAGVDLHTDDHPILEYSSPYTTYLYQDLFLKNLSEINLHMVQNLDSFVLNETIDSLSMQEFNSAKYWRQVIVAQGQAALSKNDFDKKYFWQKALNLAQIAYSINPGFPSATKWISELQFYSK